LTNSDFVLLKYTTLKGKQINVKRHNTPGNGYDFPIDMEIDASNNIFLIGNANFYTNNSDVKIIAYNTNFMIDWVKYIDKNSLNDEATDFELWNNELIVTATLTVGFEKRMLLSKFEKTTGNEIWKIEKTNNLEISKEARSKKIKIVPNGDFYSLSEQKIGNTTHLKVEKYNKNGEIKWEYLSKLVANEQQKAIEINVKGHEIFVTAIKETNTTRKLIHFKLKEKEVEGEYVVDTNGKPVFAKNYIITRFQKEALNLETIDNLDIQFGTINQFLKPTAANQFLEVVQPKKGEIVNKNNILFYRIFRSMTTADSIATSHLGEQIKIPDFYAAFMVYFPDGYDMPEVGSQLESIFPTVVYTDPIVFKEALTNDPEYPNQSSLHPTATYPDAGINVEEAWNYSTGKSFVKLGIFDSGINKGHEEFGNGNINESSVKGSYDFISNYNNSTLLNPDNNGHGTNCAGIIGATRNNSKGIAGIAGGNGNYTSAVSLYDLKILFRSFEPQNLYPIFTSEHDAIVESCRNNDNIDYGYGLNVQNHSWRINPYFTNYWTDTNINLLTDAVNFAFKMKTVVVAGRGNSGYAHIPAYPASIYDDWVLTVGGTGTDGQYWDAVNDNQMILDTNTGNYYEHPAKGDYGWDMDFAAPASFHNTITTSTEANNAYGSFNGTSGATPHVAGTVALMMSYFNNPDPLFPNDPKNLAPEDCEQLLQYTATDVNTPYYDVYTGNGRINAGKAMSHLDRNLFSLRHIESEQYPTTETITQVMNGSSEFFSYTLEEAYQNIDEQWFSRQAYKLKKFKITHTVAHDISTDSTVLLYWPRASSSNTLRETYVYDQTGANPFVHKIREYCSANVSNENAILTGFYFEVYDLNDNFMGYWPKDPASYVPKMAYSVLVTGNENVGIEKLNAESFVQIYPNPTSGSQELIVDTKTPQKLEILLYDLSGKLVKNVFNEKLIHDKTTICIDLSNFNSGLYVYYIKLGDEVKHFKVNKL
jgi:subtilisin family serine protease